MFEGLPPSPVQHREGHQVDEQADGGDDEHESGLDVRWIADPPDGLDEHVHRDGDQQQPVGDGGQDLHPLPAERASSPGRPLRQRDRPECQGDPDGVGGHVPGIGEQGQGPGQDGADHLQHEHRDGEAQDERQPTSLTAGRGDRGMAVTVSHPLPSRYVRPTPEVCLRRTTPPPGWTGRGRVGDVLAGVRGWPRIQSGSRAG